MIKSNLRNVNEDIVIKDVRAKKEKRLRAEPVATLYEQNKVKHIQYYAGDNFENKLQLLESQMLSFSGNPREKSPDRLDALVYAIMFLQGTQERIISSNLFGFAI